MLIGHFGRKVCCLEGNNEWLGNSIQYFWLVYILPNSVSYPTLPHLQSPEFLKLCHAVTDLLANDSAASKLLLALQPCKWNCCTIGLWPCYIMLVKVCCKIVAISHCCNPSSYNIFLSLFKIEIAQVIKRSFLLKAMTPLFYILKSQDISNHVISVVIPEYSTFHIRKVNTIKLC